MVLAEVSQARSDVRVENYGNTADLCSCVSETETSKIMAQTAVEEAIEGKKKKIESFKNS